MDYGSDLWAERSDCGFGGYVAKRYRVINSKFAKENNENYLTDEEQHKIIIKDYDMLFEYREQQKRRKNHEKPPPYRTSCCVSMHFLDSV